MATKKHIFTLFSALVFCLTSCKTYYIPVNSFKQQFADLGATKMVVAQGPYGVRTSYTTYPINFLKCMDKDGKEVTLQTGPSLQIRFIDNQNKSKLFFFDLMRVEGDIVTGSESRFWPTVKGTISLNNTKTIEIHDDKHNYHYVE